MELEEKEAPAKEAEEESEKTESPAEDGVESDITEKEEDDDEQEIPVDQLSEIDSSIIELLVKSGFETLAELSVTKTQELAEIEGIDEETAVAVIEAAKKQMENMDSV